MLTSPESSARPMRLRLISWIKIMKSSMRYKWMLLLVLFLDTAGGHGDYFIFDLQIND